MLAAVTAIGAMDEIEGMLTIQKVATHLGVMTALRGLKGEAQIAGAETLLFPHTAISLEGLDLLRIGSH